MAKHYIKPQIKWTEEKINLLKKEYPYGDLKSLQERLGLYSYTALKAAAKKHKIKRLKDPRKYKLKNLAHFEDLISLYWLGFIVADGNLSDKGILRITSNIRDQDHLNRFKSFLGINDRNLVFFKKTTKYSSSNSYNQYCCLSCTDAFYGNIIVNKLDIRGKKKTYNPPNINFLNTAEKALSFFIGSFDGDGCLDYDYKGDVSSLKIEIHSNWLETLQWFGAKLRELKIESKINLSSRGFAQLRINRNSDKIKIKMFALNNLLPFMDRKLGKINENKILNKDIIKDNIDEIIQLRKRGLSFSKIAKSFNVGPDGVRNQIKRLGIEPDNFS